VFTSSCYGFGARVVVLLPAEVGDARLRRASQDRLMLDDGAAGQSCQRQQNRQGRPAASTQGPQAASSQQSARPFSWGWVHETQPVVLLGVVRRPWLASGR
jgi:hypothetical protein